MTFKEFRRLCLERREVRRFKKDPIPKEQILELLECARSAPSTYNLQPVHYYITDDEEKKKRIREACMNLKELAYAPLFVVLSGDRKVITHHMEEVFDEAIENDVMTEDEAEKAVLYLRLNFDQGLFGLTWLAKSFFAPLLRFFQSHPVFPAVHKRYWLAKEVMLQASYFLLACEAQGLHTCLVDIVDEMRLRKAMDIPFSHVVPCVIAVGHADELKKKMPKLDQDDLVHQIIT